MKISKFNAVVAKYERGKRQIDIAQISEVFKIVNRLLFGIPYLMVKLGIVSKKEIK